MKSKLTAKYLDKLFGWEKCDHKGIGEHGCELCDPNGANVLIRRLYAENRSIRAQVRDLKARLRTIRDSLRPVATYDGPVLYLRTAVGHAANLRARRWRERIKDGR
jgi:hypothetical protein